MVGWVAHQINSSPQDFASDVGGCTGAADLMPMPENVISSRFGGKLPVAPNVRWSSQNMC